MPFFLVGVTAAFAPRNRKGLEAAVDACIEGWDADFINVNTKNPEFKKHEFEWLSVQKRWLSSWDGSPGGKCLPITEAPTLNDIFSRCSLDDNPPTLRVPPLPALINRTNNGVVECLWPQHPTARLSIAVLLQKGERLATADLIANTAFLHALAGDIGKTRGKFFLQWHGETLCTVQLMPETFRHMDGIGHRVERLITTGDRRAHRSSYVTSLFRIECPSGSRRVVITSEVDASSTKTTNTPGLTVGVIEVKSTRKGREECDLGPRTILQIALNGAVQVACARVDRAGEMVVCPYVRACVLG